MFLPLSVLLIFGISVLKIGNCDVTSTVPGRTTKRLSAEYYRPAEEYIWPLQRPITFRMSNAFSESSQQMIKTYLLTISAATCVTFHEYDDVRDSNSTVYINFIAIKANYCDTTAIGYQRGDPTVVRLGPSCFKSGIIYRAIFHALGLYNEQQRGDRDKYIYVNYENLIPQCRPAFDIIPMDERVLSARYDFDSVLHWDNRACAKWPNVTTIEAIKQPRRRLGNAQSPSPTDYQKLSNLYCNGSRPFTFMNTNPQQEDLIPIRQYLVGHLTISLWPDGVIYFRLDESLLRWQRARLESAISLFNEQTCAHFIPLPGKHDGITDYVEFTWNPDASNDGYMTDFYGFIPGLGKRIIELGPTTFPNDGNWKFVYWALMALLGVTPEHRRPDRDKNVIINWANIEDGMDWAFQTYLPPFDRRMIWTPYDLSSIMHPTANMLSRKPGRNTISSRDYWRQVDVGASVEPTEFDLAKINNLYCYNDFVVTPPTVPTTTSSTTTTPRTTLETTTSEYYDYYEDGETISTTTSSTTSTTTTKFDFVTRSTTTPSGTTKPFQTVFPPFVPSQVITVFPTLPNLLPNLTLPNLSTFPILQTLTMPNLGNLPTLPTLSTVPSWSRPLPVLNFTLDDSLLWKLTIPPDNGTTTTPATTTTSKQGVQRPLSVSDNKGAIRRRRGYFGERRRK